MAQPLKFLQSKQPEEPDMPRQINPKQEWANKIAFTRLENQRFVILVQREIEWKVFWLASRTKRIPVW